MPIFSVQAAGALLAAAPLAQAALSTATTAFADLLSAALSKPALADGEGTIVNLDGLSTHQVGAAGATLRRQNESLLQQFHSLLQRLLAEHDIDQGTGFRVTADPTGEVHVAGDHPEAFRIEGLFASLPELRQLAQRIFANENLLRTVDAAASPPADGSTPSLIVDQQRAIVVFD